jgi:hypothetical protein
MSVCGGLPRLTPQDIHEYYPSASEARHPIHLRTFLHEIVHPIRMDQPSGSWSIRKVKSLQAGRMPAVLQPVLSDLVYRNLRPRQRREQFRCGVGGRRGSMVKVRWIFVACWAKGNTHVYPEPQAAKRRADAPCFNSFRPSHVPSIHSASLFPLYSSRRTAMTGAWSLVPTSGNTLEDVTLSNSDSLTRM